MVPRPPAEHTDLSTSGCQDLDEVLCGAGQPMVGREQRGAQTLGQGDIDTVLDRDGSTELPRPIDERNRRVSNEAETSERGSSTIHLTFLGE